jgi:hypothetical protein
MVGRDARAGAVDRALTATRQSAKVSFLPSLDVDEPTDWQALAREVAALANSGGGAVVVGVDPRGATSGWDAAPLLHLAAATVADRLREWVDGDGLAAVDVVEGERSGASVAVVTVPAAGASPLVVGGAVPVRHGARTEPARAVDLQRIVSREVRRVRREWLADVNRITHAPPGSQVVVQAAAEPAPVTIVGEEFRVVDDPKAPAVGRTDFDRTHPFREVEVVRLVNEALGTGTVGHYDVQCVRRVYDVDHQQRYFHRPKFGSPQYSQAFVDWLITSQRNDTDFFTDAKSRDQARRKS